MMHDLFLDDLSLWSCIWQSTLFALIGLIGSFLLRRRPARASQVLFLAMIAVVLVPAMSVAVKHFELGLFATESSMFRPQSMLEMPTVSHVSSADVSSKKVDIGPIESTLVETTPNDINIPWRTIMLCGWVIATLLLLGRLFVSIVNGVLLLRRAQSEVIGQLEQAADFARARLGIAKRLQVRVSRGIRSPVIWCWSRTPILVIPSDLDDAVDWVGVISHELAHWRRLDHVSGLIAELVVCILPWNPLVWLAKKLMVRFSEQACDDWVVAGGEPCEDYAQSLLNFKPQKQAAFVPAVVHSGKGVAARVRRILKDSRVNPRAGVTWALTMSILIACLAIGLACAQTRPAKPVDVAVDGQKKSEKALHKALAEGDVALAKSLISEGVEVDEEDENGETALTIACRNGHKELVELLIKEGADINANGQPLHAAAWEGHKDIVELLLDSGADVDAIKGKNRWTPLHSACNRGNVEVAEVLIVNGADVNALSGYDSTPMYEAFWNKHWDTVKLLINNGADVNHVRKDESPPIHYAIRSNDTEVAKLLVNHGADFNREDYEGWTAFRYAVGYGNVELVDFLIAKGAKVSDFHFAAWRGDLTVVERFLDQGTDVNIKDDQFNWTPLHWATFTSQRATVEFLIAKGADVNAGGQWNDPPLHYAAVNGHKGLVELLLAKGAEVNAKDNGGKTGLHDAAWVGHLEIVELLIGSGADLNAEDGSDRAPLYRAVDKNHPKVVGLLATNGADVNAKDKYNRTSLYIAYQRGDDEIIDLLSKYGATGTLSYAAGAGDIEKVRELIEQQANVNQRDENGKTPLHRAASMGHIDVAELLLNKGANIDTKAGLDENGSTSLQLAADKGKLHMVKLLVAKGADVNAKIQKEGHKDRTAKSLALGRNYKEIVEFLYAHGADIPKIHLAAYRGDLEAVKSLIEGGIEVDAKDDDGTPLHYAAMAGNEAVAQYLIDSDANTNAGNRNGWTPLHFAAIGGSDEVARMLVAKGADVEIRSDNGQTPLLRASAEGNKEVIEVLLDNGADVNIDDQAYGYTPLHYAAQYGHMDVVELLIDKKASIEAQLTTGHTPLALAKYAGHTAIAELLSKHEAKE